MKIEKQRRGLYDCISTYTLRMVPNRVKSLAAGWQLWDSTHEGVGDHIHIEYDGEYGSERVLIVSRDVPAATVIPLCA